MKPPHAILTPNSQIPVVTKEGFLTPAGNQLLQQVTKAVRGQTPQVNCTATNVGNVLTLTPFNISPQVFLSSPGKGVAASYVDFLSFAFVSPFNSTASVTATVVPDTGTLPTIPVYKNHGQTAVGNTDLVKDMFYIFWYVSTLNSGNGAFVTWI